MTITRTSADTGERQDMFGYKARHIKTIHDEWSPVPMPAISCT